jgi:hypothetical protein
MNSHLLTDRFHAAIHDIALVDIIVSVFDGELNNEEILGQPFRQVHRYLELPLVRLQLKLPLS